MTLKFNSAYHYYMVKCLIKNFIIIVAVLLLLLYFSFLSLIPIVVNSSAFIASAKSFISGKYGVDIEVQSLKLRTYPNLSFTVSSKKIVLNNKQQDKIAEVDNLFVNVKPFYVKDCNADYLFADLLLLKNLLNTQKQYSDGGFDFKKLPSSFIKSADIEIFDSPENNFFLKINNFKIYSGNEDITVEFKAKVDSSYFNDSLFLGDEGRLIIKDSELYSDNFSCLFGSSKLKLDGKIVGKNKTSDLKITGKNLPAHDIEASIVYFQKLRQNGKVFLENFKDFSGTIDADLYLKDWILSGTCTASKLAANSVLFNVPIFFNTMVFNFKDGKIWSEAYGTLGGEKVYNSFILSNLGSAEQEVTGYVSSILTNNIAAQYIPDVRISGSADTSVNYFVKNGKVDVNYLVKLNSGSDLYYKDANLGLYAFDRRLFVRTEKQGGELKITHYDYSLRDGKEITNIILGEGLLLKENSRFALQYITCKTNGFAPVSVTGSFGKYIDGGIFDGDLKYDAKKGIITGEFTVEDSHYKDFYLEKAVVTADDNIMNITAEGTYDDYPYNCKISAKNDFNNEINIYNMDLFLEEFVVRKGDYKVRTKRLTVPESAKNTDISIDNWTIRLNKISHKRILLENIFLSGNLKNNVFNFLMNDVSFAKGILKAKGSYDFSNHSSCIDFIADKIDSSVAADVIFGLPDQISGLAGAQLHAESMNKLKDIKATAVFSVDDGYLPKLGSTEFIIKKSGKSKEPLKIKLSDITNLDISKSKAFASDIKGSFDVDNYNMKNINITSKQKYLSLFIEGGYDIQYQYADLRLWGKYNKAAQKGVRVLFVPLSWVVKILFKPEHTKELYKNKIDIVPDVVANPDDVQAFRVKVKGNINNNNVSVELKSVI